MNKIKVGNRLKAKHDTEGFKKGDVMEIGKITQREDYKLFYLDDERGETHIIYTSEEMLLNTFERQEKCKN